MMKDHNIDLWSQRQALETFAPIPSN